MPSYAGYLCWQGVVEQADLPAEISELLADRTTIYKVRPCNWDKQPGEGGVCCACVEGVPQA